MRTKILCVVGILASLLTLAAGAQQGHPLVGVWSGDWGPTAAERHLVVLELLWKDTTLSGNINPGEKDEAVIKVGKLDSTTWSVHIEGEGKDAVKTVLDGKIDNLGSAKRTLSGTWTRGGTKGTFKVTRE